MSAPAGLDAETPGVCWRRRVSVNTAPAPDARLGDPFPRHRRGYRWHRRERDWCGPGSAGDVAARASIATFGQPELEAIQQTGLLRGGRPGDTFWTDAEFTSAAEAQEKLALPVTPELRVRFIIVNAPTLTRSGSVVEPAFGGAGGGHEWASPDPVQVEIVDVQPLT